VFYEYDENGFAGAPKLDDERLSIHRQAPEKNSFFNPLKIMYR
jgi:hypothetical protein